MSCRFDKEGHAMVGQSLTELKGSGKGGFTNWKTLAEVKTEHLGHGEKVNTCTALSGDPNLHINPQVIL